MDQTGGQTIVWLDVCARETQKADWTQAGRVRGFESPAADEKAFIPRSRELSPFYGDN
jgi:hypothetical protein